jgi:outer membrane protein assembly factor BamB
MDSVTNKTAKPCWLLRLRIPRRLSAFIRGFVCGVLWFIPAIMDPLSILNQLSMHGQCDADEKPRQAKDGDAPDPLLGDEAQQLHSDRRAIQQLQTLNERLNQRSIQEVRELLRLLGQADPQLMMPSGTPVWEPLYRSIFRSFHRLPEDQQKLIRDSERALAESGFRDALQNGKPELLLRIILRYPGSEDSYRSHLLMAQRHLDRGHRLAALHWLQPLLDSGIPLGWKSKAAALHGELLKSVSAESAHLSGDRSAKSKPTNAQTVTESPNPTETEPKDKQSGESTADEFPRNIHWEYQLPLPATTTELLKRFIGSAHELELIPSSNWLPVVDKGRIYIRTLTGVAALGLSSGEPQWAWTNSKSLETQIRYQGRAWDDAPVPPGSAAINTFDSLERSFTINLLFRNGVIGRITEDRHRLFLIQDDWLPQNSGIPGPFFPRNGQQQTAEIPPAALIALDKETGRRLWTVGGEPVEAKFGNELTRSWIAGPPTVHHQLLYCVFEQQDAVHLACLSAETGHLQWRVQLMYPRSGIAGETSRRMQTAIPVVRGGLVWTNTTTGWLVSVDQLTKSVIWALPTKKPEAKEISRNVIRGGMFINSQPSSLRTSWPVYAPVASGTSLTILPSDTSEIVFLNSLTGKETGRHNVGQQGILMYSDEHRIVIANQRSIQAISMNDGTPLWTVSSDDYGARPTGAAVLRNGLLVCGLSNGWLCAVHMSDGSPAKLEKAVQSGPAWGSLLSAGDDIVAYTPDRVVLVSARTSGGQQTGVLEQAELLADAGDGAAGLELLNAVNVTSRDLKRVREIRFRCFAEILRQTEEPSAETLAEIEALAESASQKARVIQLQMYRLIRSGNFPAATERIAQLLSVDREILEQPVEHVSQQREADVADFGFRGRVRQLSRKSFGRVQMPLRTWLLTQTAEILAQLDDDAREQFLRRISTFPDEHLLQIPHSSLQPVLLSRSEEKLKSGELSDICLHLIVQSLSLSGSTLGTAVKSEETSGEADPGTGVSEHAAKNRESALKQIHQFRRRLAESDEKSSVWKRIRLRLLNTLLSELREHESVGESEFAADSGESSASPGMDPAEFASHRRRSWSAWPGGTYSIIPLAQSTLHRQMERPVATDDQNDVFLSSYEWQIQSSSPPFLKAHDVIENPDDVWSISGNFPNASPYMAQGDLVSRAGSIVMVNAAQGMTGYSILDHRAVWNRQIQTSGGFPMSMFRAQDRHFQSFDVADRSQLASFFATDFSVPGRSARWICFQTKSRLEVFDSLTGQARWWLDGDLEGVCGFATEQSLILIDPITREVAAYSMTDGSKVVCGVSSEDVRRTLIATREHLVSLRRQPDREGEYQLVWILPCTGEVFRSISFSDVRAFQFHDARTLVAFGHSEFQVINLTTGQVRQLSVKDKDESALQTVFSSTTLPVLCSDPVNYYAYFPASREVAIQARLMGRELTSLQGELLAIDRETGRLRWKLDAGSALTVTFDQPSSPVLLLIYGENRNPANAGGLPVGGPMSGMSFRGILKTTGEQLFEHRVSSRLSDVGHGDGHLSQRHDAARNRHADIGNAALRNSTRLAQRRHSTSRQAFDGRHRRQDLLILAPLLAECGLQNPMLSGRGLGATGGTLDKLEAIPGFRTNLSLDEITRLTQSVGCVITGPRRSWLRPIESFTLLRDVTATVPSIPLITGSIMSKKLAESLDALVLDVKFGSGAFMKTREQATLLAHSLVNTGERMGVRTTALLTDMNQPLGRMCGNAVEVLESSERPEIVREIVRSAIQIEESRPESTPQLIFRHSSIAVESD